MAEENGNGGVDAASPRFSVVAQYVKDFSFENPNAPRSFGQQPAGLNLQVNVNGRQIAPDRLRGRACCSKAAPARAPNVVVQVRAPLRRRVPHRERPADQVQPLAMIEGPRLLFPFARQIIADAVRNGGYPPLYVDPIDFHRLYLQRLQATGAAPANA